MMTRISRAEAFMRMAEVLALRSLCSRKAVGALVTDAGLLQVLGIGYNGNAAGLPNQCDTPDPPCGCVHAEINALLKAPGTVPEKRLFTTVAPCSPCAKAVLNSGVSVVYYRTPYRVHAGIAILLQGGVCVFQLKPDGRERIIRGLWQLAGEAESDL
jgi:dCMP deaminase